MRGLFVVVLAVAAPAYADEPLPRSGYLQRGLSVDLLELGPLEVHSAGGTGYGVRLAVGGELETGPHWAIRVPLVIGVTSSRTAHDHGYAELDLVPGLVYRIRSSPADKLIPYVGGGVKLGAWGADRPLVGQPLVVARMAPGLGDLFDDHHHSSSSSGGGDPNFDAKVGTGVELWAGVELHARPWFTLVAGIDYGLVRVDSTLIHAVAETLTVRFSL